MFLKQLQLYFFRNYENVSFDFSEEVNCILGENGSGKTNLLDAIYYLSLSKSSLQSKDELNIKHNEKVMALHGVFSKNSKEEKISLTMTLGERKQLLHDMQPYERYNDHIGKYPVVLIAPDDTDIVRDGSETRRKLFDGIIAQVDNNYLDVFQKHNRLIDQRNKLLKQFVEKGYFDHKMLETYNERLVPLALEISTKRVQFLKEFEPVVQKHYEEISKGKETITLKHITAVGDDYGQLLKKNQEKDRHAQRTTMGIHKDEYEMCFDGEPFKKFASQGQKKSLIMAIKMAQFDILQESKGVKPILLLDDIFDKLDDIRISMLVSKIEQGDFGQVFISDARPERSKGFMKGIKADVRYFYTS